MMSQDNNSNIREQIIIPDGFKKNRFDYLSDIELAAAFSKNKNNFAIFEKLLLELVDNNIQLDNLLEAIIYRELTSSLDAIKLLIKYGIDVNCVYDGRSFPLVDCCVSPMNSIETFEILIEAGANVNKKNEYGETVLMKCIVNCTKDLEIIKLLIRKGSKINCQDYKGNTELILCFKSNSNNLIKYHIIELLLDNKADVYLKNIKGKNILDIVKRKISSDNSNIYSLIFDYKNLKNDHFCEFDIDFIYNCISKN